MRGFYQFPRFDGSIHRLRSRALGVWLAGLSLATPLLAQNDTAALAVTGSALVGDSLRDTAANKVDFSGHTTFTTDELRGAIAEQIRELQEKGISPARADDAAYYVGAFYRKGGFSQVAVEYTIKGGRVLIRIAEGTRSLLRKITFAGNTSIPDATLYDYMIGQSVEELVKAPEQFPYTESEINAGADRVRGLYLSEGFLNVAIDSSGIQLSANGTRADVTLRITEGLRYTFGEIGFAGQTLFPRAELLNALGENSSGPFSPGLATAMQRNLQSFYKAKGYYQAEVILAADPLLAKRGKVAVTFTVRPMGLFRFDGVTVRNETERPRLQADFLQKRFAHLRGAVYAPEKLDETFREMLRTGLFENLRVTQTPVDGDELRLDFTMSEAKAKEVGFNIGFATYDGAVAGIRLGDRNFLGRGRPLSFAAQYTQRGLSGELLYVDPWLFDTRFALRTSLYSRTTSQEGYKSSQTGIRGDLNRKILPHLELATFLEGQTVKVTEESISAADLGLLEYNLINIGFTQSTDYRNDPINPSRGFVLTSAFDFGQIDNEPAFFRGTVRVSHYQPVGNKCLLALGARAGLISPFVDELPIDVRFFNGGASTVRSFAERELGPHNKNGNPLGGEFYTVFNVEFTFPLKGALQGAAFIDAGSLKGANDPDSGELRYAVGAGLRYKLPIGPLRLDYGLNPTARDGEAIGAFHFSFGFAF